MELWGGQPTNRKLWILIKVGSDSGRGEKQKGIEFVTGNFFDREAG